MALGVAQLSGLSMSRVKKPALTQIDCWMPLSGSFWSPSLEPSWFFFWSFSFYLHNPSELVSLARSGGVFQGGLTFGVIFAILYFRHKHIPLWPCLI
jgi:hypothetical protein